MSSTTNPRVQLIDSDGDPCDNGQGEIKVSGVDSHPQGMTTFTTYNSFEVSETSATLASYTVTFTLCKEIMVQADSSNTSFITVGGFGVSSTGTLNGFKLFGGDMIVFPVAATTSIWLDAPTDDQFVTVAILAGG